MKETNTSQKGFRGLVKGEKKVMVSVVDAVGLPARIKDLPSWVRRSFSLL